MFNGGNEGCKQQQQMQYLVDNLCAVSSSFVFFYLFYSCCLYHFLSLLLYCIFSSWASRRSSKLAVIWIGIKRQTFHNHFEEWHNSLSLSVALSLSLSLPVHHSVCASSYFSVSHGFLLYIFLHFSSYNK